MNALMNVVVIFILYFGIQNSYFYLDTSDWRGQYCGCRKKIRILSLVFFMLSSTTSNFFFFSSTLLQKYIFYYCEKQVSVMIQKYAV